MNIVISPNPARALVPIRIEIEHTQSQPVISVTSTSVEGFSSFRSIANPVGDHYRSEFWMERPGHYQIHVKSDGQEQTIPLEIEPQIFFSFEHQFGITSVLFCTALIGVWLWMKRQNKIQAAKNSLAGSA